MVAVTAAEKPQVKPKVSKLSHRLSLRTALVALAIVFSLSMSAFTIATMAQASTWHTIGSGTSALVRNIGNVIHPATFAMPANAVLVRSSQLSTDLDDMETQPITINLGTTAITPLPSDIAKWVKVASGPQAGTTVLSVNTISLSGYIENAIQQQESTHPTTGTTYDGTDIAKATNQIAKALFSGNGTTVTLSGSPTPSQAN
jgi:uncharacterized membrane protein